MKIRFQTLFLEKRIFPSYLKLLCGNDRVSAMCSGVLSVDLIYHSVNYLLNMSSGVILTCTPRVELCFVCGSVFLISRMFDVVYRRCDFDVGFLFSGDFCDRDLRIVRSILERRHSSVLEFVDTLWFVECSRVATHEIVRHRIASYWQESQRYCIVSGYLLPRSLMSNEEIVSEILKIHEKYLKLVEKCRRFGEDEKQIYRYIIPNCALSRIFIKMNLRELCEVFIPLRMCRRAQPELRYIAIKMYQKIVQKFPILRTYTGPRCIIYGKCPEYGYKTEEEMKKCRTTGYIEAIKEHGTEEETKNIQKTIQELP